MFVSPPTQYIKPNPCLNNNNNNFKCSIEFKNASTLYQLSINTDIKNENFMYYSLHYLNNLDWSIIFYLLPSNTNNNKYSKLKMPYFSNRQIQMEIEKFLSQINFETFHDTHKYIIVNSGDLYIVNNKNNTMTLIIMEEFKIKTVKQLKTELNDVFRNLYNHFDVSKVIVINIFNHNDICNLIIKYDKDIYLLHFHTFHLNIIKKIKDFQFKQLSEYKYFTTRNYFILNSKLCYKVSKDIQIRYPNKTYVTLSKYDFMTNNWTNIKNHNLNEHRFINWQDAIILEDKKLCIICHEGSIYSLNLTNGIINKCIFNNEFEKLDFNARFITLLIKPNNLQKEIICNAWIKDLNLTSIHLPHYLIKIIVKYYCQQIMKIIRTEHDVMTLWELDLDIFLRFNNLI